MFAQSMRAVLVSVVLAAGSLVSLSAQVPSTTDTYRAAVATYVRTGNAVIAVEPLLNWKKEDLAAVIAETIAGGDAEPIEAAAMLHLEIGLALAGISTPSAAGHFDLGAQLIDGLVPINPGVRRNLSPQRAEEIAKVRSTWLGVVGSAFLSVNDAFSARAYFNKAAKVTPRSPATLTLQGTADELEGVFYNPDDTGNLQAKTRITRERIRLLLTAERRYRDALEIDPNYPLAQIRLGRVQLLFKNLKQSAEWLGKGRAGATDPSHRYLAAMFTGALQQEQKDLAGAKQSYETALALAPQSQSAITALAFVELMSGRPDHAQSLTRGYLGSVDPADAWWIFTGTLDQIGLQWLRGRVRK